MRLRLFVVAFLSSGCVAGEFSGWPQNCHCTLSRSNTPAKLELRCPDAQGNGRGLVVGAPSVANTQGWFHGSLIVLRTDKRDMFVEGLEALTEFGTRVEHEGAQMYPVGIHRAFFPATEGYELTGDLTQKMDLAESRLENATFWCEDADAP